MKYNPQGKDLTKEKELQRVKFKKHTYIDEFNRKKLSDYVVNGAIIRLKEVSNHENNVEKITIELWMDFSEEIQNSEAENSSSPDC